jgi:hypothetical protein
MFKHVTQNIPGILLNQKKGIPRFLGAAGLA